MEYKEPGRYIPIVYLLYSWGSRFGVPSKVPLYWVPSYRLYPSSERCPVLLSCETEHGNAYSATLNQDTVAITWL